MRLPERRLSPFSSCSPSAAWRLQGALGSPRLQACSHADCRPCGPRSPVKGLGQGHSQDKIPRNPHSGKSGCPRGFACRRTRTSSWLEQGLRRRRRVRPPLRSPVATGLLPRPEASLPATAPSSSCRGPSQRGPAGQAMTPRTGTEGAVAAGAALAGRGARLLLRERTLRRPGRC